MGEPRGPRPLLAAPGAGLGLGAAQGALRCSRPPGRGPDVCGAGSERAGGRCGGSGAVRCRR